MGRGTRIAARHSRANRLMSLRKALLEMSGILFIVDVTAEKRKSINDYVGG
jgi:hypothetical protein